MIAFHVLFALLVVVIALSDFLFYRIPNIFVVTFLGLLFLKIILSGGVSALIDPSITLVLIGSLGFLFFWLGFLGAGDAKALAVTSAWAVDQAQLSLFLLLVSLSGAILAVIYLIFSKSLENLRQRCVSSLKGTSVQKVIEKILGPDEPLVPQDKAGRQMMPYGVAISLGCLILMMMKV